MLTSIERIYTLGPKGTNCEAAAHHYIERTGLAADVKLMSTLETAIEQVVKEKNSALLGCVVYPELHNLCFPYLGTLKIADVFLYDTYNMVMAARLDQTTIESIASHPAPQSLVPENKTVKLVDSNAQAAYLCHCGDVDACITTSKAAEQYCLRTIKDFGAISMGFTIHAAY